VLLEPPVTDETIAVTPLATGPLSPESVELAGGRGLGVLFDAPVPGTVGVDVDVDGGVGDDGVSAPSGRMFPAPALVELPELPGEEIVVP
jgi:hypothetical protein